MALKCVFASAMTADPVALGAFFMNVLVGFYPCVANVRCAPTGAVKGSLKRNWKAYGRLVRHDLFGHCLSSNLGVFIVPSQLVVTFPWLSNLAEKIPTI